MKIQFIEGDDAVLRASAFGMRTRDDMERSYSRLEEFGRRLSNRAGEYIDRARESLNRLYDPTVKNALRRLASSRRGLYRENIIQFLQDEMEIAQAPEVQRRWILANPKMRNRARRQLLHLWGAQPDAFDLPAVGEEDPYETAMYNGLVKQHEDGRFYSEYVVGGCVVEGELLDLEEQNDLIATDFIVEESLANGLDCTNPKGESL